MTPQCGVSVFDSICRFTLGNQQKFHSLTASIFIKRAGA